MVIESRACPSCADSVPPGRLSCPHCGAVLASVAHRVANGVTMEPRAQAKRSGRAKRSSPAAARKAALTDDGWDVVPDDAVQPDPIEPASEPVMDVPATVQRGGWDADSDDAVQPVSFQPASNVLVSDVPTAVSRSPWPAAVAPEPLSPAPEPPPPPAPESSPPPALGAYVPPASEPELHPAPLAPVPPPLATAMPAELPPASILPRAWDPAAAAAGDGVVAAGPATPARIGRIAMPRIDRERIEETADAIMLVGSFGLVLSFLAPWADDVIGSRGRGYMDTWGLAGSGHIALFLLALGVLALAVLQNPIGRWLRTGVAGVALGAFVLGLAWPYVVGPLGAGPGAMLAWLSGLVLFVAGIVSLLVLRHAALPPDV
jgi:hypothetical protein